MSHRGGGAGGGDLCCRVRAQGPPGDGNDNDKVDNCDTYKADDNYDKADDNEKVELRLKRKLKIMSIKKLMSMTMTKLMTKLMTMLMPG